MLRYSWSFITFLCILGLESSHLWLVMKEEKSNQERRRREPARWNKARTCSLVWNVIYLNLLWDSRTGCVCVCVGLYSQYVFTSHCECVCVCEELQWHTPPFPIHQTDTAFLDEVTLGQPEYIYRGTFMNSGERALTGNYRPHSSVPP